MNPPVAVIDACILYSAVLLDLFMWLATAGIYLPKWTEQIHQEWIDNILKNRPDLSRRKLERTRDLMNQHAKESLVEDYTELIPLISLPNMNDRHVLAAAMTAKASVIVTFNLSDFPQRILEPYGIEAQHPDKFLCQIFEAQPTAFVDALQELISELKNPPRTLGQHLDILREQGLHKTAERIAATVAP